MKYLKKVPIVFVSVILIDFNFKKSKNYYPHVILGECNYVEKENKMTKFINDELKISFNVSDKELFDKESDEEVLNIMVTD